MELGGAFAQASTGHIDSVARGLGDDTRDHLLRLCHGYGEGHELYPLPLRAVDVVQAILAEAAWRVLAGMVIDMAQGELDDYGSEEE